MISAKHLAIGCWLGITVLACADAERVRVGRGSRGDAAATSTDGAAGNAGNGPIDNPTTPGLQPSTAGASVSLRPGPVPAPSPHTIDQTGPGNPAGLSKTEVDALIKGGPPGDLKLLYPYAGTVFPRGTLAPVVMWNSTQTTDAVYLRIKSRLFEYKAVLKPSLTLNLGFVRIDNAAAGTTEAQIPQDVWEQAAERSLGKTDPFSLELTERINGQIRGPIVSEIIIAQATFKGSIYYNTCMSGTQDLTNAAMPTDATLAKLTSFSKVLRIPPGGKSEPVLSNPGEPDEQCRGCHAVSADGSRLIAQSTPLPWLVTTTSSSMGFSYMLGSDGRPNPLAGAPTGPTASYGALYPDGSKYLAMAYPFNRLPANASEAVNNIGNISYGTPDSLMAALSADPFSLMGAVPAALYDSDTGQVVPDTGIPDGALMPMFSADGKRLVFNDYAMGNARGLAVMDYDTGLHKASNYRPLLQEDTAGSMRPGWPFFLPDNNAVVFVRTDVPNFTSGLSGAGSIGAGAAFGEIVPEALAKSSSDLYIADVASGTSTILARAMGFHTPEDAANGTTYLPFAQDVHHNQYPTVSPVAAGGYFWVFFDSFRHYGSVGVQRALWGFAIDIQPDGSYTHDPSHPPFYLPGQEFGTGNNHRAFAALDKCRPDGEGCSTGVDCCAGACTYPSNPPSGFQIQSGVCAPPGTCSKRDERCVSDADCCPPSSATEPPTSCIANFCAEIPLL